MLASLSKLIIIFLESPGALVELGMFSSKANFHEKIIVVAPKEETIENDSFICLGPLQYLKQKNDTSVAIYPKFRDDEKYDKDHLIDLLNNVEQKIDKQPKESSFDECEPSHQAYLIFEIIRISFPILLNEILTSLEHLIPLVEKEIKQFLYILEKFELISTFYYSSYKYYYPIVEHNTIKFGKTKEGKILKSDVITMQIRQAFILGDSDSDRKRKKALTLINNELNQ